MRECLGWVTNCTDEKRCPMNWLERAVTELPAAQRCHVCNTQVSLVTTEEEFDAELRAQQLVAIPVVPPASLPALYGRFGGGGAHAPASPAQGRESAAPAPGARDNGGQARPTPAAVRPARSFFCVLANGEAHKIDKDHMVVGRSRTCDIIIQSAKVSRQHAAVVREGNDVFIEDLGSANGVWRNNERLAQRAKINPGDVFVISEETLSFELR
jgi:hypothetical protein